MDILDHATDRVGEVDARATALHDRAVADADVAALDAGFHHDAVEVGVEKSLDTEAAEVHGHIADADLDARLPGGDVGDIACEVVRTGLGDLEEAVGIAGRVGLVDGGAWLNLAERLERARHRPGGRVQRAGEQEAAGKCKGEKGKGKDGAVVRGGHGMNP
jgi:hypothetical protein